MNLADKIASLRKFVAQVGPLWEGTRLSGYDIKGPYSCGNCKYMRDNHTCHHPIVVADEQLVTRIVHFPVVDPARGCCEFVDPS